jgi:hypothetical protein
MNFGTSTSHTLNIKTNNTTALSIASTGAATFSSSVDARGNISMQFDGTVANQVMLSHNGTSAILYSSGNTTKKDFTIYRDGGVDAGLIIKGSTGNVGIGTSSPSQKLEVAGVIRGEAVNVYGSTDPASTSPYLFSPSLGALGFGANGSERMRITSGGNVGIGTSTPSSTYGFSRSLVVSNPTNAELSLEATTSGKVLSIGVVNGMNYFQTTSGNGYDFLIAGGSKMTITSGGMVGIGMSGYSDMRLVVRGAATSSSTFGLRIEDSSANVTFQVRNDGFIETGTRSASPYNNSTSGRTMVIESSGGLGYTSSTRESKTNIEQLSDVSWLYQLNPVSFNYRKKDDEMKYTNEFNEEKWYGLIADEVESINEDLVFYNIKEDGTKQLAGVEYNKLIAALIKSSQEQQTQIEELKQLIKNK